MKFDDLTSLSTLELYPKGFWRKKHDFSIQKKKSEKNRLKRSVVYRSGAAANRLGKREFRAVSEFAKSVPGVGMRGDVERGRVPKRRIVEQQVAYASALFFFFF